MPEDTETLHEKLTGAPERLARSEHNSGWQRSWRAVRETLVDWLDAEASVIQERSGDITRDMRDLIRRGHARAERIGLEWSEDLLTEDARDAASAYGDEPDWMEHG